MTSTRVLPFNDDAIAEAARLILAGEPVAVADRDGLRPRRRRDQRRSGRAHLRGQGPAGFNPLIVHVPDLAAAERIGEFDDAALELAEQHWPGPLTLVVPLRAERGIAVARDRRPADDRPARAGPSGDAGPASRRRPPARRAVGQRQRLDQPDPRRACAEKPRRPDSADHRRRADRARASNRPSSPRPAARCGCCGPGPIAVDAEASTRGDRIEAPGQLASHYAPSKPLRLERDATPQPDEFLIGFGAIDGDASLSPSGDLVEAAARLFDLLHQADASAKPRIAVAPVPDDGLGAAINDRLRRAAAR